MTRAPKIQRPISYVKFPELPERAREAYEMFDSWAAKGEPENFKLGSLNFGVDYRKLEDHPERFDRIAKLIRAGLVVSNNGVLKFTDEANRLYVLWAANRGSCRQEYLDEVLPK